MEVNRYIDRLSEPNGGQQANGNWLTLPGEAVACF